MLTQPKLAPLLVAALTMPTGCRSRHHILSTTLGLRASPGPPWHLQGGMASWQRPLPHPLLPGHLEERNLWEKGACQFPKGSDSPRAQGEGGLSLTLHGDSLHLHGRKPGAEVRWHDMACP